MTPAVMWVLMKLGRLIIGGVLGGDAAQLPGGVRDGVCRCLKSWH
jgi:hypothetical protein